MIKALFDVFDQFLLELKKLNKSLLDDQQYFIKRHLTSVDEENIEKLNIRKTIDGLINQISNNQEWIQLIKNNFVPEAPYTKEPLYQDCAHLWSCIGDETQKNLDLIQVNQKIIHENSKYYQHVFKCLTTVNPNTSNVVYDSKAQIATLK